MRVLNYKADQLSSVIVPLGVQGEMGATLVRIDFSDWLLDGTEGYPVITVLDPDGHAYVAATYRGDERRIVENEDGSLSFEEPAEGEDTEATVINWPIFDADTAHYGDGAMRLLLYSPKGAILKSATARTNIAPSFLRFHGDPPEQYEFWLRVLEEYTGESGTNRAVAVAKAAQATEAAQAAHNSETAAMTFAYMAKAAAAAAADGTGETLLDAVMNLTTTFSFEIETTDWTAITGGYKAEITEDMGIVTGHVGGILMPDATSAPRFQDSVVVECSSGKVTLKTGTVPSGTVSGTIILCGKFDLDEDDDDDSVTATYWPRRASISVDTPEMSTYEQGPAVSVGEGNVIHFKIPAGKAPAIGTVTTLDYLDSNNQVNNAAASIALDGNGNPVLSLTLVRGPKGETGDMASNFLPLSSSDIDTIWEEAMADEEGEGE